MRLPHARRPRPQTTPARPFVALGGTNSFTGLETFPAPPLVRKVVLRSDEVTALCPITGQPDWYTVEVLYWPNARCLESKSFKLYLNSFREHGEFVEQLASRILRHIGAALQPRLLQVTIHQKPRGGVGIEVQAHSILGEAFPDDPLVAVANHDLAEKEQDRDDRDSDAPTPIQLNRYARQTNTSGRPLIEWNTGE